MHAVCTDVSAPGASLGVEISNVAVAYERKLFHGEFQKFTAEGHSARHRQEVPGLCIAVGALEARPKTVDFIAGSAVRLWFRLNFPAASTLNPEHQKSIAADPKVEYTQNVTISAGSLQYTPKLPSFYSDPGQAADLKTHYH